MQNGNPLSWVLCQSLCRCGHAALLYRVAAADCMAVIPAGSYQLTVTAAGTTVQARHAGYFESEVEPKVNSLETL